jgi:hypothetical protein
MANEAYIATGTALLISGAAGAAYAFSVEGVTNGTGRVSAQIDLGVSPRQGLYKWSCEVQFQATPTQYKGIALYKAGAPDGDSTQIDGDVGALDAALGDIDMRSNLRNIGYVASENAAASEVCVSSGMFEHADRYLTIVVYNDSGASVDATDTNFIFTLQPYSWQAQ